ncbi:MAG TPA: hypothetical protein VJN64_04975 [Terriglobales bacterium]|nr:hypothetical protein [Terriglobales bacterium]
MTHIGRITIISLLLLAAITTVITACGSRTLGTSPGPIAAARAFIFNSNPVGLHTTRGFSQRAAASPAAFTVNAQTTTPGGGNFSGFCNSLGPAAGRIALIPFGLGNFSDGNCNGSAGIGDVGVAIPQNGQIGNVSLDAVGLGTGAEDGQVGLNSTASGQIQVAVLHADGTQTFAPITCSLGVSTDVNSKVHCDDKGNAAHITNVVAGDQVVVRIWSQPGDQYRALRVNLEYATPTF